MAQIDLCLAQMAKETTLSYQDDFYEMYKFVSNCRSHNPRRYPIFHAANRCGTAFRRND